MSTEHDVLSDPMLTVRFDTGDTQVATLPEVLAWLSSDRPLSFAALQRHQHHPWHAFLVQLAAIALDRAELSTPPSDPQAWQRLFLQLTDGAREPWCLVVDALDKPALLQPPIPEGKLAVLKNQVDTPDALDILVTRNVDIKNKRAGAGRAEHWLFALVGRQTFDGYAGKSNYGVLRMNSGFGNRPCVAMAPNSRWNDRFRRDVAVWLEQRDALLGDYHYTRSGPALLWTLPWNGKDNLSPRELHPFFIEICRRIRLHSIDGTLTARAGTSDTTRIRAANGTGDTGDIWTPIQANKKGEGFAALTIQAAGFHYRKLHDLLFGDWQPPPALRLRDGDGQTPVLIAMALVRGQGKTEGYHERHIPIPAKARGFFARPTDAQRLGERSTRQIEQAAEANRSVLKPALCTLLQGDAVKQLDLSDKRAASWLNRLDARIDDCFFTELFDTVELDADAARLRWDTRLVALLRQTFNEALGEVPMPDIHRHRTRAAAEARFGAALRKSFPEATTPIEPPAPPPEEPAHV